MSDSKLVELKTSPRGPHLGAQWVPVPAALVLIQLPANAPGEAEDGSGTWAPTPTWEILEGAPGFRLVQLWLLLPFGSESADGGSPSLTAFQIKQKIRKLT